MIEVPNIRRAYPQFKVRYRHKVDDAICQALEYMNNHKELRGKASAPDWLLAKTKEFAKAMKSVERKFVPLAHNWFGGGGYLDDPSAWAEHSDGNKKGSRISDEAGQYKIEPD
tara:strand:- start:153 stop:491 length:339 start_codon:yes stop_codon:yes gene_type:complete